MNTIIKLTIHSTNVEPKVVAWEDTGRAKVAPIDAVISGLKMTMGMDLKHTNKLEAVVQQADGLAYEIVMQKHDGGFDLRCNCAAEHKNHPQLAVIGQKLVEAFGNTATMH